VVLTSDQYADVLTGGGGGDTLHAGQGPDQLTGGAGADVFVFRDLPWNAGHVTDFTVGVDKLDLGALLSAAGVTSADPIASGHVILAADGLGGTKVYFDPDAAGTAHRWPTLITTLDGVTPGGLTAANLLKGFGADPQPQPQPQAPAGVSLISDQYADVLVGGGGTDTLAAGQGPDVLTGGAGADHFVFSNLPWNAGHVTDFQAGVDKLDLSALFDQAGYQGSNPVQDGLLSFVADGAGGTKVYFDADGAGTVHRWPTLITTLDGVAPATLTSHDWIV
jgi:Ca2+-binding RTX toxin-like protein